MIILSLDLSFAKTGYAITKVINNQCELLECGLIVSNKDLEPIDRIIDTLNKVQKIYKKYPVDLVLKEGLIVGRASTAINVIKTHTIIEYVYQENLIPLENIHNQSIKKWAKNYMGIKPKEPFDKKKIVAQAIEKYYNCTINEIWGSRGGLYDDIADAIAITIVWNEHNIT